MTGQTTDTTPIPIRDDDTLFRKEGLISEVDLRVDVTRNMSRTVKGEESIKLSEDKSIHSRGNYTVTRASRTRRVGGDYERSIATADNYTITGGQIFEQVDNGVNYVARQEQQIIMAGPYVNTVAGPAMHIGAWLDALIWGGYMEADGVRIELSATAVRSYMTSAHVSAMRIMRTNRLMYDIGTQTFNTTTKVKRRETYILVGTPGAKMELNV